jgi:hypothetical protein
MSQHQGKQMRLRPETEGLVARRRPELLEHGAAYAVHVLLHEALGAPPPPTPSEIKAAAAQRQQEQARRGRRSRRLPPAPAG